MDIIVIYLNGPSQNLQLENQNSNKEVDQLLVKFNQIYILFMRFNILLKLD